MREILFKGKRIDNGEWVEGYYTESKGKTFIGIDISIGIDDIFEVFCTPVIRWLEVDPETLCQFTGLCDKNGKKIWENDIVNHNGKYAPVKFGMYCSSFDCGKYNFGFYVDFPEETFYRKELGYWCRKVEVAGDIFDNPELLQEKSDE
jgi:uncharacterized phage protein (TIGR01671 family)|nr:MAG TPA: YopX protein [Caudoviricetes sp.]